MQMQGTVMLVLMQYLSPDAWEVTWMKRIENNTSTSTVQKFSSVFFNAEAVLLPTPMQKEKNIYQTFHH
jgi:hypothetical protein